MAVVKADAYGHGAVEVAKYYNTLVKVKPDYYAVAFPQEAIELRDAGIKDPILIFNPFEKENASLCKRYNLIATVFEQRHLDILKKAFGSSGYKIKIHIKVNTGMNRLGIDYDDAFDFIKNLSTKKEFIIDGVYTHFAEADSKDKSFTLLQLERFNKLINQLKFENINLGLLHAANSSAMLDMPETYFDMVRCGLLLYGYYPSPETSESIKLKPVMSIRSNITTIKEVEPGETISYGRKFTAKEKTKIFSIPLGYADGYWRNLSNKVKAIIKGKTFIQVGAITMDRTMFNAGNVDVKIGDEVIILGEDKNEKITAWDWAKILNTIPYEITCGISKRIPRLYE